MMIVLYHTNYDDLINEWFFQAEWYIEIKESN